MNQNLIDLTITLPGIVLFITILVNILKHFGVVKNGETFANSTQLIVSIILTVIGLVFPAVFDWFPYIDEAAENLAALGGYVIPIYLLIIKLGNIFHDILTKIPTVRNVVGKQITP